MSIIYTHHQTVAKSPVLDKDFLSYYQEAGCEIEFLSENIFVIKNHEDKYLTAFANGEYAFSASQIRDWEHFYLVDSEPLNIYQTQHNNGTPIVYTFHQTIAKSPASDKDFLVYYQDKGNYFEFLSENCFAIRNKQNQYLMARPNGTYAFVSEKIGNWEQFYVLDKQILDFAQKAIRKGYHDSFGKKIIDYRLIFQGRHLHIALGSSIIAPSFMPAANIIECENSIQYNSPYQSLRLSKQRRLIYFSVYGESKQYYDMLDIAIDSLIRQGHYHGDILIKTDHIHHARALSKKYPNRFYFSEIKPELNIYNRYDLHEPLLQNYDSVIYMDTDILTVSDINIFFNRFSNGDLVAMEEVSPDWLNETIREIRKEKNDDIRESKTQELLVKHGWWGSNLIPYYLNRQDFHLLNSGFFIINDLKKVKPIFNRVIQRRFFDGKYQDQALFNVALYNSQLNIVSIPKNKELILSSSEHSVFSQINGATIMIHFNCGVGQSTKLALMQAVYNNTMHLSKSSVYKSKSISKSVVAHSNARKAYLKRQHKK